MRLEESDANDDHRKTDTRFVGISKSMIRSMTFESFNLDSNLSATTSDRSSLQLAYVAAQEFAEDPQNWLYLHGPTGVGKTHIAVAIANFRDHLDATFRICHVPVLLKRMRLTLTNRTRQNFYARFERLCNLDLLILDDLVQPYMTDWELRTLYDLVIHRHDQRVPTVITSQYIIWEGADNCFWQELERKPLFQSIRSRLNDSSVVTERLMAAPDYRNRSA